MIGGAAGRGAVVEGAMSAGVAATADLVDFFITNEPFMDRLGIISLPEREVFDHPQHHDQKQI